MGGLAGPAGLVGMGGLAGPAGLVGMGGLAGPPSPSALAVSSAQSPQSLPPTLPPRPALPSRRQDEPSRGPLPCVFCADDPHSLPIPGRTGDGRDAHAPDRIRAPVDGYVSARATGAGPRPRGPCLG